MATNVQPLHQYRVTVARWLQSHGWPGEAGYQLAEQYRDLVAQLWQDGALPEAAGFQVDRTHMEKPVKRVTMPTIASLTAAGCRFHRR